MKIVVCLFFLVPATLLYAQKKPISAAKTRNYIGKTVTVFDTIHEGRLKDISKDEMNVLYTGSNYAHRTLALLFPQAVLQRFSYNPNSKMINHSFYATGKIVS